MCVQNAGPPSPSLYLCLVSSRSCHYSAEMPCGNTAFNSSEPWLQVVAILEAGRREQAGASLPRPRSGDQEGYKLFTMDHSTGRLRLDLEHKWAASQPPQPVLPPPDQLCDDEVKLLLT